ncbi:methionine ABC transporter ATP-binding protein [Leucobacter sp. OLJS4]|uniref:methionine ABC transporter permease n=1 Tax=unclassified Leucobacter TaxID=2621730 RepID=UPI000C187DD3|nr:MULTISPECIES: methionine ABC transporter permease [unclassified Leucobacter]PIJ48565.1 methionine ABC transporter ATP-binding protein [Leucobacter sp. OLES1]PII81424.1 methionine ABC transporter ATP-binding protein [Leucobacter sp. OLCALW19]PII86093.1 methionine ABC transporter ATP-binding protein [Leucobacter sp. OLTLW20]PII89989.1 methionine ABC transporter ATP-binding protein [Leucobacter sp. OLAS13]PII97021.1 methionine ABC transporter ATP-binding protein [Leucobacter sp. OLDS2]
MDGLIQLINDGSFIAATLQTLLYVVVALAIGGVLGLVIGIALTVTRRGGLLESRPVFVVLNFLVNFFRPIPFILLAFALQPLARFVVGTGIGDPAFMFALSFAATFGIARLVEQNLLTVPPGVIEASRAMGAGPFRTILTVLIPEGAGPVILGYTFAFIAVVDMTAMAGMIAGGGLGNLALQYGYRQFNPWVTWSAVLIIILIVQLVQLLGNGIARKLLRR